MRNALVAGLGGPMGRYARPRGQWFNPLRWSLVVGVGLFIVLALRQVPCVQTSSTETVNAFIRLCYSDITVAWTNEHFGAGDSPLQGSPMLHPPLLGLVLLLAVRLTLVLRPGDPGLTPGSPQAVDLQLAQAQVFLAVMMLVLFVSFLVVVVCVSFLGRGSRESRVPGWDGMLVAASPVVLASGLISYDLLGIALVAVGLLQFARRRPAVAGLVLGLAAGASLLALTVALAVAFTIALRGRSRQLMQFVLPTVGSVVVVNLPLLVWQPVALLEFYRAEMDKEVGYGSLLFAGRMVGWEVRSAGSLGLLLTSLTLACLMVWLYLRHLRPRVGVVIALFVFPTVLLGASYGPQTSLWLLVVLVLARPYRLELVAFSVTQVLYWAAVWGYLAGHLSSNPNLYFLTLLIRVGVEIWIFVRCVRDAAHPIRDGLRTPGIPDPIGGVLNDGERLAGIDGPLLETVPGTTGIPDRHRP
ncbi:hypothetical protein EII34_10495 [Arachnia propionica]|uniref:DUF2029 domain-containing protein n=1 Tax=Arachnia propionica TaxID=1750 RepID=A0A3P1T608_9ACTN|nr:hypothetical protein [Arachnia propionica]RRD04256.1 hypothetical protein EII34_10495 [Arachnia propionica]